MKDLLALLKKKFGSATVIIMPHDSQEKNSDEKKEERASAKMNRFMLKNMVTKKDVDGIKNRMSNASPSA